MPLVAGARLGPYEIIAPLGEGGMGQVYRATDTTLGRQVAIKILPDAFAADPERMARFEREAKILASLNHPNIAAIYGFEKSGGAYALVMELVEGDDLSQRIARGAIPLDEALPIAKQIADALEAAHEQGIIHRDLKPANIKVRPDDTVKVLDFGLAKVPEGASATADVAQSPTITSPAMTQSGMILGTVAYMSPEQARGRAVDKRTDIWAFGCVLYEMLTGRPAFPGDTAPDAIVSVLERAPDWGAVPASGPVRLLQRCLQKNAKQRWRDIGDVRLEIDDALAALPVGASQTSSGSSRELAFQRFTDSVGMKESPSVSADGKMLAFVAFVGRRRQIWIQLVAGGAPLQITRDDVDHEQPRWAPDSSTLIYYTRASVPGGQGTIWEMSALGGPPRRLTSSIGGADISHRGERIAVFQPGSGCIELVAVARDGSRREPLARLPPHFLYSAPRWSPDDRSIAFQSTGIEFDQRLEMLAVGTGERREVARGPGLRGFAWLPDASGFVYSSSLGSTLLYPPVFNLRFIRCDGGGDKPLSAGDISFWEPDLHASGRLFVSRFRSQSDIWRFSIGGSEAENTRTASRLTHQTGHVQAPSVSPDETEVVYVSDTGGHSNLWVARTDGLGVRQISFERDPALMIGVPMWSPAGEWIVFILTRKGQTGLWLVRPDGSDLHPLVEPGFSACWSRDGRWVYYTRRHIGSGRHEKISVAGGEPTVVRDEMGAAAVGGDERTIYYAVRLKSDLLGHWSGDCEIQRVGLDDGSVHVLARIAGSRIPVSPLIFQMFLSPDDQWLATPLMDGATTNLWALSPSGGPMSPLTDFGDRSILIARSVSWSADCRSLYAAVAETESDIVSFDGLIP